MLYVHNIGWYSCGLTYILNMNSRVRSSIRRSFRVILWGFSLVLNFLELGIYTIIAIISTQYRRVSTASYITEYNCLMIWELPLFSDLIQVALVRRQKQVFKTLLRYGITHIHPKKYIYAYVLTFIIDSGEGDSILRSQQSFTKVHL